MSERKQRRGGSGCAFVLLVAAGFAAMVYVMAERSGDAAYQATGPVTVHAGPDEAQPVVETLAPGAALMCHGTVEADPRWLDCSDMLETKFVPAAAMQPIDEATFDALRRDEWRRPREGR